MADKKITALDDLGKSLASGDLFHIVDDVQNTPINKRVTAKDVFENIPTFVGLKQASEALTHTDTAIDTSSAITEVDQSAGVAALSLQDGADGQQKVIIATGTASNAITITPTHLRGGSTITLNAEGETVQCLFKNSKWNVIGGHDFVVA